MHEFATFFYVIYNVIQYRKTTHSERLFQLRKLVDIFTIQINM